MYVRGSVRVRRLGAPAGVQTRGDCLERGACPKAGPYKRGGEAKRKDRDELRVPSVLASFFYHSAAPAVAAAIVVAASPFAIVWHKQADERRNTGKICRILTVSTLRANIDVYRFTSTRRRTNVRYGEVVCRSVRRLGEGVLGVAHEAVRREHLVLGECGVDGARRAVALAVFVAVQEPPLIAECARRRSSARCLGQAEVIDAVRLSGRGKRTY